MPIMPSTIWLSREERRALARQGETSRRRDVLSHAPHCLFCLGPLANGAPVCGEACDSGWWNVVPTTDGELWQGLDALARP
jgi:hypothetical protein